MSVVNVKVANIRPEYDNLKEWCQNENNVYIGRKGVVFVKELNGYKYRFPTTNSLFSNPYKVGRDGTRQEVIEKYERYIREKLEDEKVLQEFKKLKGKNLGCWCKPEACHGDILLKLLNEM